MGWQGEEWEPPLRLSLSRPGGARSVRNQPQVGDSETDFRPQARRSGPPLSKPSRVLALVERR